jgi:hypothetical protein
VRLAQHVAQALELRAQPPHLLVAPRLLAREREHLLLGRPARLELRLQLGHPRVAPRQLGRMVGRLLERATLRLVETALDLGEARRRGLPLALPPGGLRLLRRERRLGVRTLALELCPQLDSLLLRAREAAAHRLRLRLERRLHRLGVAIPASTAARIHRPHQQAGSWRTGEGSCVGASSLSLVELLPWLG